MWYINRNMNPWHPAHLLAIGLGPLMVITSLINSPSGRNTLAGMSGFFLIMGTAIYYLHGWSTGPLVGAWAYSIGFSGLLGVDLSQIWASKAAGVSVALPFLLSAFGFISLLLGSVCAISALDRTDDPFDRFGIVCWQLGSMAVAVSTDVEGLSSSESFGRWHSGADCFPHGIVLFHWRRAVLLRLQSL